MHVDKTEQYTFFFLNVTLNHFHTGNDVQYNIVLKMSCQTRSIRNFNYSLVMNITLGFIIKFVFGAVRDKSSSFIHLYRVH